MLSRRTNKKSIVVYFLIFITLLSTKTVYAAESNKSEKLAIEFTEEEKAYIEEKPLITIAMDTSWTPYCFFNEETKKVDGILPNILNHIADELGMQVEYVACDTYRDAIQMVHSGKTMMVSGIADVEVVAAKTELLLSDPYIDINYCMATKGKLAQLYDENQAYKVAVCKNSYSTDMMKEMMPSYEFIEYNNNNECMEAVSNSEADIALVAVYSAEYYSSHHEYSDLTVALINDFGWKLSFGLNKNIDPIFVSILNKGIALETENDTNDAIYSGLVDAISVRRSFKDWFYEQPVFASCIVASFVALILLVIFMIIMHKQKSDKLKWKKKKMNELQKALDDANQANKVKNQFYSQMSHDMRTPMNGILGIAQLSMKESSVDSLLDGMRKVEESGQYLLGLINDTLDYQKIDTGKLKIDPEIVYIKTLLSNIVDMVGETAEKNGVQLMIQNEDIELDSYARVDTMRVRQIFVNLLSNAIKFTPKGGSIVFTYKCLKREEKNSYMLFTIQDSGIGMSEDFLTNGIFKPFSQEKNELTSKFAGSGLGLSIVKSLVELMNGKIEVTSTLGIGTTFSVFLNIERVNKAEAEKYMQSQHKDQSDHMEKLKNKKILLAEDHPLNMEIAKRLLERMKCDVTTAENGKIAVQKFSTSDESILI